MKRLILLVFILIGIPVYVITSSSKGQNLKNNYSDLPKDDKWEFVKERLFDGDNKRIGTPSGPILIQLINAKSVDSVALNTIFKELRAIIPQKEIDYFNHYTGRVLEAPQDDDPNEVKGFKFKHLRGRAITICITEVKSKEDAHTLNNEHFLKAVQPNFYGSKIVHQKSNELSKQVNNDYVLKNSRQFTFKFHESQTTKERIEIIRYYLVWKLGCASLFKDKSHLEMQVVGAILNSNETSSWYLNFTAYDKFLLQKLYSPNLLKEYKDYMSKTYPRWFLDNFENEERTKLLANWTRAILSMIFFFLTFSILYKRPYKFKYLSYFVPIFIACICLIEMNLVNSYLFPTGKPFNQEKFWSGFLVLFKNVVLIAFFLWLFDKYIIKREMSFTAQLVLKVSFTFLVFLVPFFYQFLLDRNKFPNLNWDKSYNFFLAFNSPVTWAFLFSLGRGILLYLDHFSENLIKQKDIELSNLRAINAQAEVKLLQSQINPHFLYNALNSIASLAQTDAVKTEKMALSLSDLFKYTINRKGKKNSTIGDEVEMVKNYLEVEQIRFGDRLTFHIDVDDNLKTIEIPMFLIQPLIENAVKHGISKIENDGEIILKIYKNQSDLIIKVIDNGPQFSDGLVSGHGLQTVYDLLWLSYGHKASLGWENTPEKSITITINKIA